MTEDPVRQLEPRTPTASWRSFLVVVGPDAVSRLLQAFAGLLIIRILSSADFATLTIVLSAIAACTQPLTAAANRLLLVGGARGRGVDVPRNTRVIVLLAAPATFIYAARALGPRPQSLFFCLLLSAALTAGELKRTSLQVSGRLGAYGLSELLRGALIFTGFATLTLVHDRSLVLLGSMIAVGASYVAPLVVARAQSPMRREIGQSIGLPRVLTMRELLSAATLYAIIVGLASQVVLLQLSRILPVGELATFSAAFRLYALSFLVVNSLHAVILATIGAIDEHEVSTTLRAQRSVRFTLAGTFALLALTVAWWMPFATGGRYLSGQPALTILLLTGVSASTLGAMVVVPMRQGRWADLCWIAGAALGLQLVLTSVLARQLGALGGAIAVFISFTLLNLGVAVLSLQRSASRTTRRAN